MREKLYHVEVLSRTDSEARVPCILPVSGRHLVGFEELLECSLECKEEEWLFLRPYECYVLPAHCYGLSSYPWVLFS